VWLCGPETSAWTFELSFGVEATGVRFRPGVAPRLWGLDASALSNRRVHWRDVVGDSAERDLIAAITAARPRGADARIEVLENAVAARVMVAGEDGIDDIAEAVLERLAADPHARVSGLAAHCGLTERQLLRRCHVAFGYGVSTLARIIRFHRFWSTFALSTERTSLAGLAAEAGYTDQAHLVRDCRAITGLAPRQFLAEAYPTFPDMSDPYKTNGAFATTLMS